MLEHVINQNPLFFCIPDELEDIYNSDDMRSELGDENEDAVYNSIKSINEVIQIDKESDHVVTLGEHSYQVIKYSLDIIKSKTKTKPEYLKKVISLFHLDKILNVN